MEIWKDCVGFEGIYQVSNIGMVKRSGGQGKGVVIGKILKPALGKNGYLFLTLRKYNRDHHCEIHRLVAKAFHGDRSDEGLYVAHNDGVKTNNTPDNLRWATQKENMTDTESHGTKKYGEKHYKSIFTEDQVIAIINDKRQYKEIANDYGVCRQTIGLIKNGKRWAHLNGNEKRKGRAKISEDDVRAIRKDSRANGEIANDYGLTGSAIASIKARKSWKHVD